MIDGTSALEEKDQDLGLKKTDLQCCKVRTCTKDKGWGRPQATRMHLIPPTCALKAVETVCFHHIGWRAGAEAQWVECFPSACKALVEYSIPYETPRCGGIHLQSQHLGDRGRGTGSSGSSSAGFWSTWDM